MENPYGAGDITATVCARTEVRDALGRGDWKIVLRAYLDAGMSQTKIAAAAGMSQSQISRLAGGKIRQPGITTIKALTDGLGIPRSLVGLMDDRTDEEDNTDRRQFLAGSLGVVGAAVLPQTELGDERHLVATSLSYRRLEQHTPAQLLIAPVRAHLALITALARRAGNKQRRRLSAAVSEAAGLAAWLHADLVEPVQVRQFYRMSVKAAEQSGQGLLAIYMQGSYGQYATDVGDARHGVDLLRDAEGRLPRSAPASARAWLSTLLGVALSRIGDRAALASFDMAERHADAARNAEPVWPWVFSFDSDKIAGYRAVAAGRLGELRIAEEAYEQSARLTRSPKQSAVASAERARTLAAAGDVEAACELAVGAIRVGHDFESERVCQAVREFRAELQSVPSAITEELDHELHRSYTVGR